MQWSGGWREDHALKHIEEIVTFQHLVARATDGFS
jgi:hypothetical protein